jgi:hypothetical protein
MTDCLRLWLAAVSSPIYAVLPFDILLDTLGTLGTQARLWLVLKDKLNSSELVGSPDQVGVEILPDEPVLGVNL